MNALIIFAKAPVPGEVKTRLQPHLSPEECATLHKSFVRRAIAVSKEAGVAPVFLGCHPDTEHRFFHDISAEYGIPLFSQQGKDLGERMENAFRSFLKNGYEKVVIIGSDSPDLPPEYIRQGFAQLEKAEMVLGPARDGGYYLIGLLREVPVFNDIPWGTERVFEMTIKKAEDEGVDYSLLPEWHDIDTWEDLQILDGSSIEYNTRGNV